MLDLVVLNICISCKLYVIFWFIEVLVGGEVEYYLLVNDWLLVVIFKVRMYY